MIPMLCVYPMLAMFLWTFLILLRNVQVRVSAVLKGQLSNEYFELFRGGRAVRGYFENGKPLEKPNGNAAALLHRGACHHADVAYGHDFFDAGLELFYVPRGPWIGVLDPQTREIKMARIERRRRVNLAPRFCLSFSFSIQIVHIAHVDLIGAIFRQNCLQGVNTDSALSCS